MSFNNLFTAPFAPTDFSDMQTTRIPNSLQGRTQMENEMNINLIRRIVRMLKVERENGILGTIGKCYYNKLLINSIINTCNMLK